MKPKQSLGKGLGALFPDILSAIPTKPAYVLCGIDELVPNRFQPRRTFDAAEQNKLAASIRKSGLIQPIVARKTDRGYEIIAGERRWRAAQEAGMPEVPVILREAADLDVAEMSLIENLLREDLNPLEEAEAYQTLANQFGLTQEDVAERIGKDRSTVANTVRLLKLPPEIQQALADKALSAGHARALLTLHTPGEQLSLFRTILRKNLTVRATERLAKQRGLPKSGKPKKDRNLSEVERALARRFLTDVQIRLAGGKGTVLLRFHSREELDRLLGLLLDGVAP